MAEHLTVAEPADAPKVSMENDQHEMKSSWLKMKVHSKEDQGHLQMGVWRALSEEDKVLGNKGNMSWERGCFLGRRKDFTPATPGL